MQSTLIISLRWNEQEKMVEVNQFFCGLHYLVGLADQAEACLKIWESIIHKDKKVGSIADGGYSNSKSGVTRLRGTVCIIVNQFKKGDVKNLVRLFDLPLI